MVASVWVRLPFRDDNDDYFYYYYYSGDGDGGDGNDYNEYTNSSLFLRLYFTTVHTYLQPTPLLNHLSTSPSVLLYGPT